jgi:hypothetical protein
MGHTKKITPAAPPRRKTDTTPAAGRQDVSPVPKASSSNKKQLGQSEVTPHVARKNDSSKKSVVADDEDGKSTHESDASSSSESEAKVAVPLAKKPKKDILQARREAEEVSTNDRTLYRLCYVIFFSSHHLIFSAPLQAATGVSVSDDLPPQPKLSVINSGPVTGNYVAQAGVKNLLPSFAAGHGRAISST